MGDMAELAAEEYYKTLAHLELSKEKPQGLRDPFKTENVLNRTYWVDGWGFDNELKDLGRDHLQNILHFIYRNRDRYWLNCNDVSMIERYKDGDEFFQKLIRKSTIWKAILTELQRPEEAFNFNHE